MWSRSRTFLPMRSPREKATHGPGGPSTVTTTAGASEISSCQRLSTSACPTARSGRRTAAALSAQLPCGWTPRVCRSGRTRRWVCGAEILRGVGTLRPWRRTSCSWRRRPQVRTSCSQLSAPRPVTEAAASRRRSSPLASTRHGKGISRRDSKRRRRKMSPCTNGAGSDRTVRRSRSEAARRSGECSTAGDGARQRLIRNSKPPKAVRPHHGSSRGRLGQQRCET